MKRWALYALISISGLLWLSWAAPRWHPATRIALQMDRDEYLAKARQIAAENGVPQQAAIGVLKVETQNKNQALAQTLQNPIIQSYPNADVVVNLSSRPSSTVTLRTDGRPLGWKLPMAKQPRTVDALQVATSAMQRIVGQDASAFVATGATGPTAEERSFTWRRSSNTSGSVKDGPEITVEILVRNGYARQATTTFFVPEPQNSSFDRVSNLRAVLGVGWFLLALFGAAYSLLKQAGLARALKDWSGVRLSVLAALCLAVASSIQWDSATIDTPEASGRALEFLGICFSCSMFGFLFYLVNAATLLNARFHPQPLRGFRLLATRAIFSRVVNAEILGGLLFAPVFAGIPLLIGRLLHVPLLKTYDDDGFLNRAPILNAIVSLVGQDVLALLVLFGVMLPLALRFKGRTMRTSIALTAFFFTVALISNSFRSSLPASLACFTAIGLLLYWLYTQFGLLGALVTLSASSLLNTAWALFLQPGYAIHTSGKGLFWILALITITAAVVTWKGTQVVTELYGETAGRIDSRSRREEILAEFNVARSAQQKMLPSRMPKVPGYTVSASCDPAREVGGDLYDFMPLRGGRIGIGVADVSGKGVPAALYMTFTKGLLSAASQDSDDPRVILGVANTHLREVARKKMFVTMALGVLDPLSATVDYARAGHNPVVWRRRAAGETRMLAGAGIGLGIAPPNLFARTLAVEQLQLAPGDALVFYSDGLTEAMNATQEQFGDDRLMAAVERTDGMHAFEARDSILGEVKQFLRGIHPQDDLTIAVLRMNEI